MRGCNENTEWMNIARLGFNFISFLQDLHYYCQPALQLTEFSLCCSVTLLFKYLFPVWNVLKGISLRLWKVNSSLLDSAAVLFFLKGSSNCHCMVKSITLSSSLCMWALGLLYVWDVILAYWYCTYCMLLSVFTIVKMQFNCKFENFLKLKNLNSHTQKRH